MALPMGSPNKKLLDKSTAIKFSAVLQTHLGGELSVVCVSEFWKNQATKTSMKGCRWHINHVSKMTSVFEH